jgi:uncharacterized protein (DUF952 family)
MPVMYKILPRAEWDAFSASGVFEGSAIDKADGYIHFSYAHQVGETALKYFSHQPNLTIFAVEANTLGDTVKNEASRDGDLFPHLFASLELSQVLWAKPLPLAADGRPILPALDS